MKNFIAIIFAYLLLSGCANRIGDFTMVSSKNVDLTKGADFKRSLQRVKAEDTVPIIGSM